MVLNTEQCRVVLSVSTKYSLQLGQGEDDRESIQLRAEGDCSPPYTDWLLPLLSPASGLLSEKEKERRTLGLGGRVKMLLVPFCCKIM